MLELEGILASLSMKSLMPTRFGGESFSPGSNNVLLRHNITNVRRRPNHVVLCDE